MTYSLRPGTLLQKGKYKIEQTLGQGSFGITYLAIAKFSTNGNLGKMDVVARVAIKEFFMSDINGRKEDGSTVEGSTGSIFANYKTRFRKEAENLSKLQHPNIVKVFDVFDENNTTYYVMEYLSDTNLNQFIKNKNGLSETECIALTEEIGGALQYLHDSLMLHLDLKPGNIMLRNNEAVLIDFWLSKQFNANGRPETSTTIGQGTPGYAPLEQQNYNGCQSKGLPFAMDVYALGGTMFKMITGHTPPDASSIFNDGFPKDELAVHKISTRLANIIEKAMAPSKKERYQTVTELLQAVNPSKDVSKNPDKGRIPFWVAVHLILISVMLSCFLCEHVYRGCLTPSSEGYPNTYFQTLSQAISTGESGGPYGSIILLILGWYFLLQIIWNRKMRIFSSICGVILIGLASLLCDLFGGCNFDNMIWIVFAILSVASSWCISQCTPKTSK